MHQVESLSEFAILTRCWNGGRSDVRRSRALGCSNFRIAPPNPRTRSNLNGCERKRGAITAPPLYPGLARNFLPSQTPDHERLEH